jgi:hypothetical protein
MSFANAFMAGTLPWTTCSTGLNRTHSLRSLHRVKAAHNVGINAKP